MTRSDEDFRVEIEAHIALETDRLIADGMVPANARDLAIKRFGGVIRAEERFYESARVVFLDHAVRDARYALRSLSRSPLFAATAALSVAIGIGAVTAVFTIANALLLRASVGIVDPDRLVDISRIDERSRFGVSEVSYPVYLDIRERATLLEDAYGYEAMAKAMSLALGGAAAERIFGHVVSANYFEVLGVTPAAGRLFTAADRTPLVVLSDAFWARRFQRDPSLVGQNVRVNGKSFTIAGVASAAFRGTSLVATDIWTAVDSDPVASSFLARRDLFWGLVRGRLKPGATVAQLAAEIDAIAAALADEHPETLAHGLRVAPASRLPGNLAVPLGGVAVLLMGFVSLVLVIACANLAGILIARASARRRELAVRIAVGASRAQLVRQSLTETLVLFLFGGAGGLVVAQALTTVLLAVLPALPLPLEIAPALDMRVAAFAAGLSVIAALSCGIAPALHASATDAIPALKDGVAGASARLRLRHAFVLAQVALSVILAAGAGLFIRALQKAVTIDTGFRPDGVELVELDLGLAGPSAESHTQRARELLQRIAALPGVRHAALAASLPTGGRTRIAQFALDGADLAANRFLAADSNVVSPRYFATLGVPVIEGRDFDAADREGSQLVAIVSAEAARHFWPRQTAIGKTLQMLPTGFRRGQSASARALVVVGVVGDVRMGAESPRPTIYLPYEQRDVSRFAIIARSDGGAALARSVRQVVASVDRDLPILTAQALDQAIAADRIAQRVAAISSGSLGAVGLLLAVIGVYGVTAYTVSARTREIGIRLALGAQHRTILRMVLGHGLTIVVLGAAIGISLAAAATRVLHTTIAGFPGGDLVSLAAPLAIFVTTGLAACFVPARRALRIDPTTALRCE